MKKTGIIAVALLLFSSIGGAAQTTGNAPQGEAIVQIFTNFHSGFGATNNDRGFALDRSYLGYDLQIPTFKIGTFDTELVEEFFLAFTRNCPMSLHIRQLAGKNSHHIVEGCFKSVARSLKIAVASDGTDEIPSTKGVL